MAKITCPDCGAPMVLRSTKRFLHRDRSPRKFYGCILWSKCKATHGAHPDGRPLGTPADQYTKAARIRAHVAFDALRESRGWMGRGRQLRGAYLWLGRKLGIPENDIKGKCHMAMFDGLMCARVVQICQRAMEGDARAVDAALEADYRLKVRANLAKD